MLFITIDKIGLICGITRTLLTLIIGLVILGIIQIIFKKADNR